MSAPSSGVIESSPVFPFARDEGGALMVCFHHAGGSASAFRPWTQWQRELSVLPVELPGKATRSREAPSETADSLVTALVGAIAPVVAGRDYVLYGHSMGAMLAFETAVRLEGERGLPPAMLVVAGRHAPTRSPQARYRSTDGDQALIDELRRLGGTPAEALDSPELLAWLLPRITADYRLDEALVHGGGTVSCPISAHIGTQDQDTPLELVEAWGEVTRGEIRIERFEGDHFFPYQGGRPYYRALEAQAAAAVSTGTTDQASTTTQTSQDDDSRRTAP